MRLVNLTPHAITLRLASGEDMVLAPTAPAARVVAPEAPRTAVEGLPLPVVATVEGEVDGLPAPEAGTAYVVSAVVLAHPSVRGRTDVYGPGTGPSHGAVREAGQVRAVTCLVAAPADAGAALALAVRAALAGADLQALNEAVEFPPPYNDDASLARVVGMRLVGGRIVAEVRVGADTLMLAL